MGNVSDKLQYLAETKEAIKDAIKGKGVAVADTDTFRSYAKKINSIKSSAPMKDVNLFDYDGTILYSYTKDEFLDLTALPTPPTIEGLQSSWCNTLTEAQEYVNQYGIWDIGVAYDTNDKYKSELYFEGAKTVVFSIMGSGRIEWGDGTAESVDTYDDSTNSFKEMPISHTYDVVGNYSVRVNAHYMYRFALTANNPSNHMLKRAIMYGSQCKAEFSNCSSLESLFGGCIETITDCHNLKTLIIPNNLVTFRECASLELVSGILGGLTFPSLKRCISRKSDFSGFTSLTEVGLIGGGTSVPLFTGCIKLPRVTYPTSFTSIKKGAFDGCRSLREFAIPPSATRIEDYTFRDCVAYQPTIPSTITYIGKYAFANCQITEANLSGVSYYESSFEGCTALEVVRGLQSVPARAFANCSSLAEVEISRAYSIGASAFSGCSALAHIELPNSVSAIHEYAFAGTKLTNINLPPLETLGISAFRGCSLKKVTVNAKLRKIGDYAFANCYSLEVLDFRNMTAIPETTGVDLLYRDLNGGVTTQIVLSLIHI